MHGRKKQGFIFILFVFLIVSFTSFYINFENVLENARYEEVNLRGLILQNENGDDVAPLVAESEEGPVDVILKNNEGGNKITGGAVSSVSIKNLEVVVDGNVRAKFRKIINNNDEKMITTDIFAMDPAKFEEAEVSLKKYGDVTTIYTCREYDFEEERCYSEWEGTNISFQDDSGFVTFKVEHFSGYAGGTGYPEIYYTAPTPLNDSTVSDDYIVNVTINQTSVEEIVYVSGEEDSSVVAMYNFDGDATDSSGNENNGTVVNAIYTASGKYGGAYSFDNDGDWIDLGTSSSISGIGSGSFSLCTWFKTTDTESDIISNGVNVAGDYLLMTYLGKLRGHLWTSSSANSIDSSASLNDGSWHHGCQVVDDSNIYIYVDGELDNSQALVGTKSSGSGNVYIGTRGGSGTHTYSGTIDEVKIVSRAMTAGEIKGEYLTNSNKYKKVATTLYDDDLVAMYNFEDATDSSIYGNDG
ncbi:LamG domain-containing protein, partial [Candidatus Woesearchaeota archaeon]|nr:LamG domain-containing protein [Candidatus Woesearchaeota archaeon]